MISAALNPLKPCSIKGDSETECYRKCIFVHTMDVAIGAIFASYQGCPTLLFNGTIPPMQSNAVELVALFHTVLDQFLQSNAPFDYQYILNIVSGTLSPMKCAQRL